MSNTSCPSSERRASYWQLLLLRLLQLQILLISIRSTDDEQFYRMGSLAWLGYLSYTQVVESSNLSPSIFLSTAQLLDSRSTWLFHPKQLLAELPFRTWCPGFKSQIENPTLSIINLVVGSFLAGDEPFHYPCNTFRRLVQ